MRRVFSILLGVAVLAAGLYGLLVLFSGRDSGGVAQRGAQGPGELEPLASATPVDGSEPPTSGAHRRRNVTTQRRLGTDELLTALEQGNVVIVYPAGRDRSAALIRLQREVSGPFDPELAAAGQMVVVAPWDGVGGVQALAYRRRLRAERPDDPRLRAFAEAWLGQGEGNTG